MGGPLEMNVTPGRSGEPTAPGSGPLLDTRVRWRMGRGALLFAGLLTLAACFRPLTPGAPAWIRLTMTLALGLSVVVSALLASLRGRGWAGQWALYLFLLLSLDGLGQLLAPVGWPAWPLLVLLFGAMAVAEPLRPCLGLAAVVSLLALADAARGFSEWPAAAATALGYTALVVAVNRALRVERGRLAGARGELAQLRHGIDHLDEIDPVAPSLRLSTAALTLRQISEDGRRARQVDRAGEVDEDLGHLVRLARLATSAHAVFYFDIDRRRESAFLRAADGPDSITHDSVVPLERDPFAFVLDRGQPFYATDFPRLLWNLPYYGREVRIGSILAVPARRADVVCGVLVADKEETQAFTGAEPTLLGGFAEMATRAIQQVLESGSREEMGTEFKAVYAVSKNLARVEGSHSLRRLLVRSARDMVSSLGAVAIVSTDESETRYVVEAEAHGWPQEFAGREVGLSERTWAAWVLRSAEEPYLLDALADQKDSMPILTLDEGSPRAESLLMLPLRAGDRNLGALVLTGKAGTFDATVLRVLGILTNQTAAALATIRHLDRSKQLAIRDGLTRLYNRRAFDEALDQAVAREDRKNGTLSVLLLDIDHFKKLNDTHGHQAGDEALRHMAVVLQRHLRQGDLAARYGGEEFVVILPATDQKGAIYLAERVRKGIAKASVVFEGARLSVTVSLGMAVWPSDGRDTETLMSAADQALYAAKDGGRNRMVAASSLASKTDAGA